MLDVTFFHSPLVTSAANRLYLVVLLSLSTSLLRLPLNAFKVGLALLPWPMSTDFASLTCVQGALPHTLEHHICGLAGTGMSFIYDE